MLKKYFAKVPSLRKRILATWTELFWKTPLKTFTELFIEISFGFFINLQDVTFYTINGVIASLVMYATGVFVLLYSFILLDMVCKPPNYVKRRKFNK